VHLVGYKCNQLYHLFNQYYQQSIRPQYLNDVSQHGCQLTLPHCLHLPFCERRWTQWWWMQVCSRYWRTPTSLKVALQGNLTLSIKMLMQLVCAIILQAEHFILGPCFWNEKAHIRLHGQVQLLWKYQCSILHICGDQSNIYNAPDNGKSQMFPSLISNAKIKLSSHFYFETFNVT
jgi:hypothetical protein